MLPSKLLLRNKSKIKWEKDVKSYFRIFLKSKYFRFPVVLLWWKYCSTCIVLVFLSQATDCFSNIIIKGSMIIYLFIIQCIPQTFLLQMKNMKNVEGGWGISYSIRMNVQCDMNLNVLYLTIMVFFDWFVGLGLRVSRNTQQESMILVDLKETHWQSVLRMLTSSIKILQPQLLKSITGTLNNTIFLLWLFWFLRSSKVYNLKDIF